MVVPARAGQGCTRLRVWVGTTAGDARTAARALAVALAAHVCDADPGALTLERAADGRPVVPGSGVQVSLSHGRGAVAAAAGFGAPVGVDVEAVRELPVARLARRWFAPQEAQRLERCDAAERSAAFLELWTQKEAVGKAVGRGLEGGRLLARPMPAAVPGPAGRSVLLPVAGLPGCAVAVARVGGLVVAVAARGAGAAGAVARVECRALPGVSVG